MKLSFLRKTLTKKGFIVFVVILLFIPFCSCLKIGIAPSILKFKANADQVVCKNITLFSNSKGILIGQTQWANEDYRELSMYDINENEINLNIDYPKQVGFEKADMEKQVEICIIGEKKEKYYGALTYRAENSHAGVGIWMRVEIISEDLDKKEDKQESSLVKLKGLSSNISYSNLLLFLILIYSTIFLLLILALLSCRNCSR